MSQVYLKPLSHVSLPALLGKNHKKKRSADYLTVTERSTTLSKFNKYFTDNTITNITISLTATTFSPYVPGLYGTECVLRALAYMKTHQTTFTVVDIGCACLGNCPSYLSPNPAAASYYQWFLAVQFATQIVQRLRDNAPYIALICFFLLIGLTGNRLLYNNYMKF